MARLCALTIALIGVLTLSPAHAGAADVLMWHNDKAHHGLNDAETVLTPANVSDRLFGQLFTFPTDGYTYAQPLVVTDLDFSSSGRASGKHTAVFVATEHDSVYAFDTAGNNGASSVLWHASLIDPQHRITPVPTEDTRSQDLVPEIGITSTPAIDRSSGTIYVVARTKEIRAVMVTPSTMLAATMPTGATRSVASPKPFDEAHWVQKLHALELRTGREKPGSPVLIGDSYQDAKGAWHDVTPVHVAGTGAGNINGVVYFNALREHQRSALMLDHGRLYVSYASHGDQEPVHGWILAFDAASLHLLASLCTSPNGSLATSWMAGAGPAVDDEGNLYLATGNGEFTADKGGRDYGESVLRVAATQASAGTLSVVDYFTPSNFEALNDNDLDLGSGGPMLMPTQASRATALPFHPRLIIGGKEGILFLLNADQMGHLSPVPDASPGHAVQIIKSMGHLKKADHHEINIINTPACLGKWLYYTSRSDPLTQFQIEPDGTLGLDPLHQAKVRFNFPPPTPSISANAGRDGIVWVINNGVPATLLAYDASDVSRLLYDSNASGSRDRLDGGVKFTLPTIANGKVFVGTQDNLTVFGLLPAAKIRPATPSNLTATAVDAHHIDLSWQRHSDDETATRIERSANDEPFRQIDTTGRGTSSYADRGDDVSADTVYRYRITATNNAGDSHTIESARVTTPAAAADSALIGHWTMDEGTGSRVADVGSQPPDDGTIHGEVVWAHGHVGAGALGFHGAGVAPGYVEIPDSPKLHFRRDQSFTLVAWVQPAAPPGKWAAVVARATEQTGGFGLWCDENNRWCFGTPTDPHSVAGGLAQVGWHQLVGVQDGPGNRRQLYVDGQKVAETAGSFDADSPGDLWIGGSKGDESRYIDARVDDVRLYNRALGAGDVAKLYSRHNPLGPAKLLAEIEEREPVRLRWSNPPAESGALPSTIRVERSINGSPFSQIARLSGQSKHFEDDLPAATAGACTYRVAAENSEGDSDFATAVARNRSVTEWIKSFNEQHAATTAEALADWRKGDILFMDRDFIAETITAQPNAPHVAALDLSGAEVIRTGIEDQHQKDYSLTYTLAQPCVVYLMIDQRNVPKPGLPSGASQFTDTHTQLDMGDAAIYEVFSALQSAGDHTLGPHVSASTFYWLAVMPDNKGER